MTIHPYVTDVTTEIRPNADASVTTARRASLTLILVPLLLIPAVLLALALTGCSTPVLSDA